MKIKEVKGVMTMKRMVNLDFAGSLIDLKVLAGDVQKVREAQKKLYSGTEDFTGWVKLPFTYDKEETKRILETAERIRTQCEVFIVIGIGGSYLGARAAISALKQREKEKSGKPVPEIYFAGQNLSGTYHRELLEKIKDREICLCVISKSGTTTEPSIAFSVLKDALYKKYGKEEANKRIYAITDAAKGTLREEADREGYVTFTVPDDIGGRYSVLTPVGLLPIAVAGIDILDMLEGARVGAKVWTAGPWEAVPENQEDMGSESDITQISSPGLLALTRVSLLNRGKFIEVFEYYEPQLQYFTEWLKQLFGESEGKDGTGIFPASLQFSADLHSMGQFLQEGKQIFFETILNLVHPDKDLIVPDDAGELLAGKSLNSVNRAAMEGVMAAHAAVGVPMIRIDIPELSPYYFGQMVYFFETSCALSGYLLEVNPFDQPGVESYKKEMRRVLKGDNNEAKR